MSVTLVDQSLVVHLFAPRTGPKREIAYAQLTQVWRACADGLGMAEPILSTGLPLDPPVAGQLSTEPSSGPMAARSRPGPGLHQAIWTNQYDVSCLSIAMSGPTAGWSTLHARWSAVTAGIDLAALLGQIEEFTALTVESGAKDVAAHSATVAAALPRHLSTDLEPAWRTTPVRGWGAVVIWQVTPGGGDEPLRRLVITAPADNDPQLSAVVWTGGTPDPALLTRYLIHAAKLRYQVRVRRDEGRLDELRDRVAVQLNQLRALLDPSPRTLTDDDLDHAELSLAQLQAGEAGLIDAAIALTVMRRTGQIAAANMRSYADLITTTPLSETGPDNHPGPRDERALFNRDQALAAWFDQQLDDDLTYLGAARDRAQLLGAAADREIRRRRHYDQETNRRHHDRFTLLQTAIIGATLMGLTAIQSLDYRIPLPDPVKPAAVTALGAATFWLSAIAVRFALPRHPGRGWLVYLEFVTFGLLTAALTWLVTTWYTVVQDRPASTPAYVLVVVAFVAGTALAAMWRTTRRPARPASPAGEQ